MGCPNCRVVYYGTADLKEYAECTLVTEEVGKLVALSPRYSPPGLFFRQLYNLSDRELADQVMRKIMPEQAEQDLRVLLDQLDTALSTGECETELGLRYHRAAHRTVVDRYHGCWGR